MKYKYKSIRITNESENKISDSTLDILNKLGDQGYKIRAMSRKGNIKEILMEKKSWL